MIGGVAAVAAWAVTDQPVAAVAGVAVGVVGGALIQVGLIGWGVSPGLRHAEESARTARSNPPNRPAASRPTTSVRPDQPDPNLPPWDQPEGRSYR